MASNVLDQDECEHLPTLNARRETVCRLCGLVLDDDTRISDNVQENGRNGFDYVADFAQNQPAMRFMGEHVTKTQFTKHMSLKSEQMRRLHRAEFYFSRTMKFRTRKRALWHINNTYTTLGIALNDYPGWALQYFSKVRSLTPPGSRKGYRFSNAELAQICVVLERSVRGIPVPYWRFKGWNKYDLVRVANLLGVKIQQIDAADWNEFLITSFAPCKHVERVSRKLARLVLGSAVDYRGQAAAAYYLAARYCPCQRCRRTQAELCKFFNITEVTLRARCNDIRAFVHKARGAD